MEIQEAIDFLQQNGYDIIPPVMSSDIDDFEKWWNMYDKKRGRDACLKKWRRLSLRDRKKCLEATPLPIVLSTIDKARLFSLAAS